MSACHLAELNIARLKAPLDSPELVDFVANLQRINALAESSPGFVWLLKTEAGDATSFRPLGDDTLVNMSVWQDLVALNQYVYRSEHVQFMRRRKEWFDKIAEAHLVLWWIRKGHTPTLDEAIARLEHLRRHGPTPHAFTFRDPFPAPDTSEAQDTETIIAECPT